MSCCGDQSCCSQCCCRCPTFNTLLLKFVVIQQLVCSFLLLVMSSICTSVYSNCQYELVFWSGLVQSITAILGFHFLWRNGWNQCLLVAYFVLVICYSLISIGMFITAVAIAATQDDTGYNIVICILHAFSVVSCVAAFIFICSKWCRCCAPVIDRHERSDRDLIGQNYLETERNPQSRVLVD